jgi:glycine/D-amino acid oxidase-like deaminating enzyme
MTPADNDPSSVDALVIGGGFYGCVIAAYLARARGMKHVSLIEQMPGIMQRASYHNQARVHGGYHYPRSFTTAYRSRQNYPRFLHEWPSAIRRDFVKLYAIARHQSKVTPRQFERFCHAIGAPLELADERQHALFEARYIEAVYRVEECAFDATKLAAQAEKELAALGVQCQFERRVTHLYVDPPHGYRCEVHHADGSRTQLRARTIFNCSYSGLNQLGGDYQPTRRALKHELTEMALIEPPADLNGLGVTVMDGPFFSTMPFPARGLHTLSHVRYTPHRHWADSASYDPYRALTDTDTPPSRADRMIRDASRYLPALQDARQVGSLYEIKTILTKNEADDGRPILFEAHQNLPGCYSILGSKIDTIYDVLERLDATNF